MGGKGTRGIAYVKGLRGRSASVRYGVTLALCAAMTALMFVLQPYWDPSFAVLLLAATAIAAWLCGFGPALATFQCKIPAPDARRAIFVTDKLKQNNHFLF